MSSRFTEEDHKILKYGIAHNLGVRLAEATQHLFDDYAQMQQRIATLEAKNSELLADTNVLKGINFEAGISLGKAMEWKVRTEQAERDKEDLRLRLITAVVNEEKAHTETKRELARDRARSETQEHITTLVATAASELLLACRIVRRTAKHNKGDPPECIACVIEQAITRAEAVNLDAAIDAVRRVK